MTHFLHQLGGELQKLFGRKRTYIGFGAFFAVEMLVLVLLQLPNVRRSMRMLLERAGYGFEQYFSGLTLAFMMLTWTLFFLGALYVSLVAGDVVSKEVEEGTMRMALCRPISRGRVLLLRFAACFLYTFVLIHFIGLSALVVGMLKQGPGGMFVFMPMEQLFALFDFRDGLMRFLAALPAMSLSMLTISAFAFMLSCFNMKPAAATICTLTYFFLDGIFRQVPYFESLKPWFLTTHMNTWMNLFQAHIPWLQILEDYVYLSAFDFTFVLVGFVHFHQRDFKS